MFALSLYHAKVELVGAPNEEVTLYVLIKGEIASDTFVINESGQLSLTCSGETAEDLSCSSE